MTTGTLPGSVTPGKPFTLTNYGLKSTLPGNRRLRGGGHKDNIGRHLHDVGHGHAGPRPTATTAASPCRRPTSRHRAPGAPAQPTARQSTSPPATRPGRRRCRPARPAQLVLTVTLGTPSPLTVHLNCTNPATQIASTSVAAPQTTVAAVLPNSGPLAGWQHGDRGRHILDRGGHRGLRRHAGHVDLGQDSQPADCGRPTGQRRHGRRPGDHALRRPPSSARPTTTPIPMPPSSPASTPLRGHRPGAPRSPSPVCR